MFILLPPFSAPLFTLSLKTGCCLSGDTADKNFNFAPNNCDSIKISSLILADDNRCGAVIFFLKVIIQSESHTRPCLFITNFLFVTEISPRSLVECVALCRFGNAAPGLWAVCDEAALGPASATLTVHTAWSGKQQLYQQISRVSTSSRVVICCDWYTSRYCHVRLGLCS